MSGYVKGFLGSITLLSLLLVGCVSRQQPAPVERLYQGKSIHDFTAASLRAEQYTVERGDTLYSIAFRANLDVRTLAAYNELADPYLIQPGQVLQLKPTKTRVPPQLKTKVQTRDVDPDKNTEYLETKSQQSDHTNAKEPPRQQAPLVHVPVEVFPSNQQIRWQWPTEGRVSQEFSNAETGSKGLDIAGERGQAVRAAAAGKVVYAGNALRGFGQLIILKHNDDYISAYAHNQQLLVQEQQWVNAGETIAKMGDTDAEQVKLHFQVRLRGVSVNPRNYLPRGRP